jgi:hypothetical protein
MTNSSHGYVLDTISSHELHCNGLLGMHLLMPAIPNDVIQETDV